MMKAPIAVPTEVLKTAAPPYLYSGPSPVASLPTVLEGLRVNETRGDRLRAKLPRLTGRVLARVNELAIAKPNRSGFPIVEVPLADPDTVNGVLGEVAERFKLHRAPRTAGDLGHA